MLEMTRVLLSCGVSLAILIVGLPRPILAAGGIKAFNINASLAYQGGNAGGCNDSGWAVSCQNPPCRCEIWAGTVHSPLGSADVEFDAVEVMGKTIESKDPSVTSIPVRFDLFIDSDNAGLWWAGDGALLNGVTGRQSIGAGAVLFDSDTFTSGTSQVLGKIDPETHALRLKVKGSVAK
jgi:hypothetical protein